MTSNVPLPVSLAVLRLRDVIERTGMSRSTIYAKQDSSSRQFDASFPSRISLGESAVGWRANELEAWIASRPKLSSRRRKS